MDHSIMNATDNVLTIDAERRACTILEQLIERLRDAEVDYECQVGMHQFIIMQAGSQFRVQIPEQSLLQRTEQQLEDAITRIIEKIRNHTAPLAA
jgi:hypothetical protein